MDEIKRYHGPDFKQDMEITCGVLSVADERPDKNLEETKAFPNDYTHNRARDVIKGILDKSIKPGGIREIKRAVADREKDDAKGPKPLPSKALRLNAASWLTGR